MQIDEKEPPILHYVYFTYIRICMMGDLFIDYKKNLYPKQYYLLLFLKLAKYKQHVNFIIIYDG